MPGKVKVKILSGRNLPVMDRSSDTTDAYVEVKLGTTTFKTDVCRKSLNPQWNSEWYRFELDDAELQDEPLQIRIMDHDTYSANDAIGKVYIDLNPLLLPQSGSGTKNSDSLSSISSSSGGSVMSGWFPVYDTMHGIRGEVNVIVKVDLFTDFNKFRQSSCGVQFFNTGVIPQGYTAQIIHGFVEELVVSDDPEYQWIEKIRTPRASNEARQTTFFKLSGEVQRKIGLKVLELGGNCVIGYHQVFDLEGESGIVVRGIGTAVTLVRTQDSQQPPGSAPPQISLPPYTAPTPAPNVQHDDQRIPSFLTLPKLNLSRLSPNRSILNPLSRLSPRLKRKFNTVNGYDTKSKSQNDQSPGTLRTHSLDSSESNLTDEPDFNYSMNILLQQEDGRKHGPKKNRLMQAITSIPRSSRKIYKKFSNAEDNISIASKMSLENTDVLLSQVLEDNSRAVDDSFELSSSSSSTTSSTSSSSSCTLAQFEPLIYNYEQPEPVIDLSNIKHFPRRNSDYSDEVNCILNEKYGEDGMDRIDEKREREERAKRIAERRQREAEDKKRDEELYRKLARENDRGIWPEIIDAIAVGKIDPLEESVTGTVKDSDVPASKGQEQKFGDQLSNQSYRKLADQGSPKTRKVSMFEGNLLEPNRENPSRRYSDASQLSPQSTSQATRRHSSSDIQDPYNVRDRDTWKSFETVYGRRLSDLPDLVTVKMSEKKKPPAEKQRKVSPNPVEKVGNELENVRTKIIEAVADSEFINDNHNKRENSSGSKVTENTVKPTCGVEIKVDEVSNETNNVEDSNSDVTQQINESFSFLDSREGTPPMSEMEQVECGEEKKSYQEKLSGNKESRPYLSKNRIAYKETIFTPRSEMMLTVTEPSFDSSSSRQVSFDTDTSHDDLVLESSKEEIEFTGSHFLDLKPKLSKSYENLSSLNDEDLSPERSFSLANLSDDGSREKKAADRSKKINASETFPGPSSLKHFCDPVQVFWRPLEKLSEEGDSQSPSLSDEDGRLTSLQEQQSSSGDSKSFPNENRRENLQDLNVVSDHGDSSPTTSNGQKLPDQTTDSRERNNSNSNGGFSSSNGNQNNGGDDGENNHNRNYRQIPQDKQDDEEQEEDDREKTPPLSRMSPIMFGDEDHSSVVNFLSYNVTKKGGLLGADQFDISNSQYEMSLMNMTNVSRSNPNLNSDTKVRLTPRDKSRSMFDLVIVSNEPDKASLSSRRSSVKKNGKMFRRRESKSAENVCRTPSDRNMPKQPVLSDEHLQNSSSAPAPPLARRDSVFARRKISLTNDNRRESKSNGNLTESVENLASTLLTRRGSVNLNRKNSVTRKMSLTGEQSFLKRGKKPLEQESYESVSGTVLMRRDSVQRISDGKLKKQHSLRNELDREQSQSSENIRPYTYRDPFGDHLVRTSSVKSVTEYQETLRKLLKSQESIEEINESESSTSKTSGDKKLESQSLVNITEQLEENEHLHRSDSNIHKMIAVPKPTSILKKKIDFVPIPADTKQKKEHNQSKARNFFGEDIDLNSIEYDAKARHEPSPSNAPYSRIMANREDPLETRYSHIMANRVIVKPKQPPPETKIQNGHHLRRYQPIPPIQHLKSNDYLIQTDFTTPVRHPNIDYITHREDSVDSTIVSEEIINSPLKFTDFSNNDPVMRKLLSDSKKKAENEQDLVLGETSDQNEDMIEFVTQFIDAEVKANLLQRYEEGEKPPSVSVPCIESVSLKTQNFTTKFIETERDACETQRIHGQEKKKKSVLILKSTEPVFNTLENTFIISTDAEDEALLRSKLIQEEEHATSPRRLSKSSITPTRRLSKTYEYTDPQRRMSKTSESSFTDNVKSSSQQMTAEFIEREKVYSAFQQPHLILIKKLGDKNAPPPISDGLKKELKIKGDLEKVSKFLQMERQFSSMQAQSIVKLVKKSLDLTNLDNDKLKQAITNTLNFIEAEKKFTAITANAPIDTHKPSSVPRGSNESKANIPKKKSPSKEKEKRSPSKKKRPTQDEIDMILKRQSYDFALSKMNMTGFVPNINAYRERQPPREEEFPNISSQSERSEPNYTYIISQTIFNKQGYQKSKGQQFKSERNRLSTEEVIDEENTNPSGELQNYENLATMHPEIDVIHETRDSTTPENLSSNDQVPFLESKETSPEKSKTDKETFQSQIDSVITSGQRRETQTIPNETENQKRESSSPQKDKIKKIFREEPMTLIDKPTTPTKSPEKENETTDTFCVEELPLCEESLEEPEPNIVNFFSASMETINSRHTGHSDDLSDFAESVESVVEETCEQLADDFERNEGLETNQENQRSLENVVQEVCDEEVENENVAANGECHSICQGEEHKINVVDKSMIQETCEEELDDIETTGKKPESPSEDEVLEKRSDSFPEPKETILQTLEEESTNFSDQTETFSKNGDMVDHNMSPKSSASEVLSDSTIENQLNECKNCRHPKIDSLDFLSDEDLMSSFDHSRNEITVDEQLETLEAEKQRTSIGNLEHVISTSSLELNVETCVYESEEQMILEDKSNDKSPDLVVTQETSAVPELELLTPVAAPRTKKKKKKKHHASKEDLNVTTETRVNETAKAEMISSEQGEKLTETASVQDQIEPVTEQPLPLDEHAQVNVDSQEESSDPKSKPKKKRKRRLTFTKASREEPPMTNQAETVLESDKLLSAKNEGDKPETSPQMVNDQNEPNVAEPLPEQIQQTDTPSDSKNTKKKLTRHTTQDLSALLRPEIVIATSEADAILNIPPPEIFSDKSQLAHEMPNPVDSIVEEPDICPETCEDTTIDQHEEDWIRLDEVCEPILKGDACDKHVKETCPCEDTFSDEICVVENATSTVVPSTECEVIDETCPDEYSTDVVLDEDVNVVCSEDDSVAGELPSTHAHPDTAAVDPRLDGHERDSQEISLIAPGPALQGSRRVNINTGLDVINSRLDVINQEISTIAHVLSNINEEIKHGSSTVELDVPLDISERERLVCGRKSRSTASSLPNVLSGKQQHEFCCEHAPRKHSDASNEIFKSLGTVVLKGFSAKGARLFDKETSTGSELNVQSEVRDAPAGESGPLDETFSANVEEDVTAKHTVFVDKDSQSADVNNAPSSAASASSVTNASPNPCDAPLTPLVCDANLAPSPSHVLVSVLRAPEDPAAGGSYEPPPQGVSTPTKLGISTAITRRSSESDLSITPKGNSLAGSGGSSGGFGGARNLYSGPRSAAMFKENLDMLEYPFLTMSKYPSGFILRVGGTVRANSVKLLERMTNLEEPESRDAWWTELRLEVRSHARALACNVVLGYSEHTAICDDVCVLSASGTAAVINVCLGNSLNSTSADVPEKFTKFGQNGTSSEGPLSNLIDHKTDNPKQPISRFRDNLEIPSLPCRFCHVPYNETSVPFKVNLVKCAVCKKGKVPDLIFATIDPPDDVPITGSTTFIQAFVSRSKRDCKGELNAKEISDGLPFLEYELHRQLMNKLTVKGMNALFGLKVQKCIGERTLAAYATATAVYLSPLPPPALPKVTAGDAWKDGNTIAEMQKLLQDCVTENKEFFRLRRCSDGDRLLVSDSDDSEEEILPDIDLNAGGKDTCILEMDDAEDISVVSQLIDPHPPRGFHVSSIETLPGLDQLEVVKNLQMFTQVWRSRVPSTTSVNKHFQRLLQTMYYKLRRMTPCAIAKLSFHIDIPEPEEVQLSVVGMALGLGEVDKSVKAYRRRLLSSHSKDMTKDDNTNDLIFRLDEDQNESPAPLSSSLEENPTSATTIKPPLSQLRGVGQVRERTASLGVEERDGKSSGLFTSHALPKDHYGVDITPLSYIAGGRIERYLGNLNFFFIRESNCIRESGGLSGFVHSFVTEVLAILRAHVTALGGNAMVSYTMSHCILLNNQGKNQGQCLINVGGDVVFVSYPSQGSEEKE